MADMLKFYKGAVASLPAVGVSGAIYITNDEGGIYLGTGTGMKRLGDFIQVDAIANLPTDGANTSALYYCIAENVLAKWSGSEWTQINRQRTKNEVIELLDLGSLAYLSKVTEDNLDSALKEKVNAAAEGNHSHSNKSVLDGISADDITNWNNKVDKVTGKSLIADTEITRLAGMSDGANKVEASANNGKIKIDGVETTVYTHPDKHAIAEVDGLSDALAGKQDVIPENTYDAYGAADSALTDAKAYVDQEDVFHTDILTVNALGGIAAGANLNNMTTHEILNTLLFPYVAFTVDSSSRSAAAATLENGATQTLSSASVTITKKSKPITSVKLLNGSTVLGEKTGDDVAAGGTIKFENLGITVSKSNNPNLKFTVTDGTTSTDKNVGASTFVYPYYMGECAADATIDEALVEGLTKKVESKGNKTVTHTMSNGRMVIAYPKAHGVLKSILDPNNFETIGDYTRSEVSVTGLDGTAQAYYVYASGAATVSGFKVQYKY